MRGSQRFYILIATAFLLLLCRGMADAFLGFGDAGESNKSGLNLEQGYDRNTVVKVSGTVAVPPRSLTGDLIAFDLNQSGEQLVVVLGPAWYLQDDDLDWKGGERVTVQGSLAQGRDGRTYLLTERILTPDGANLVLRGENGKPAWSGGFRGGYTGGGAGGQGPLGGARGHRGR